MNAINLNPLFIDQLINFFHLLTTKPLTKKEFLDIVELNYSTDNPKTALFYIAVQKSEFKTIRISNKNRLQVLFNQ